MQSSCEALVLGDDLGGFAQEVAAGLALDDAALALDDAALALDEIAAVGPGGSRLGRPMTRRKYRDFWRSDLLDQTRHDHWIAEGATTLNERLAERTARLLAAPPTLALGDAERAELERILRAAGAPAGV